MHKNRIDYTLPQYQRILRSRRKRIAVALYSMKDNKIHLSNPAPVTPYLPEGRGKYYAKLYKKSKSLRSDKKYSFVTLTYRTCNETAVQICKHIKQDIDKFFKRLTYHKKKAEYFYIIELTKKGFPHIHLIFDRFIAKQAIYKSWHDVTGAQCIRVKHLDHKSAIGYCIKYLTNSKKMPESYWSFIFSNISRLWSSSRHFFNKPEQLLKDYLHLATFSNSNYSLSKWFYVCISNEFNIEMEETNFRDLCMSAISNNCIINYSEFNPWFKSIDYMMNPPKRLDYICIAPGEFIVFPN